MTTEEQYSYWLKFHRTQQRYEKIYISKFNTALKEQIGQYIQAGTIMAVNSLPVYKVLVDLYHTVGPIWAQYATIDIRRLKSMMPIGFNDRIIELMRAYYGIDLLSDANNITQTTIDIITNILSDAAATGISFDDIVKKLQSPDLSAARARLISRTETVTAANAASGIAAKETGLIMDKIWISARDHRTRHSHMLINQTTIGMDEVFKVDRFKGNSIIGTDYMQYPGDIKASAENRCNCRCTHAFIPKRDKTGRLLRA